MRKILNIIILLTLINTAKAQMLFYQNTYKGGVSVDGKSYYFQTYLQADTITFQNSIPVGSTVKKAFLLSFRLNNYANSNISIPDAILHLNLNGNNFVIDSSAIVTAPFYCSNNSSEKNYIVSKDVTSYIVSSSNKLIIPCQGCGIKTGQCVYSGYLLVILYENNSMPATNVAVFLNDKTYLQNMAYNLSNLCPINTNNDVGLSAWNEDVDCTLPISFGLNSSIGNFNLGSIYAPCNNNDNSKVPGSFYYQNNTLNGLVDDTPDTFFDSTDALANIKSYIANNSTSFSLNATLKPIFGCEDMINAFIMAYSTPCPATSSNSDSVKTFTFCNTNTVQLQATNGYASYVWQPAAGLSNANTANPSINIDSVKSISNYICTVTDANGCVHTEYAQVINPDQPLSISTTTAICGGVQGILTIAPNPNSYDYTYTLNNGTAQSVSTFSNLAAGQYTLTVKDTAGCMYADTFSIKQVNLAQAVINAQPTVGLVPLTTTLQDYDFTNTTNTYNWYIENQILHGKNITYTFNTPGTYNVELIAYNNLPACADTAYITIVVEDSLLWFMPNIFTPNGDDKNDVLSITPYYYKNISWQILNRWGKEMINKQQDIDVNNPQVILWDGKINNQAADDGTYYYIINLTKTDNTTKTLKGFVTLIK